MKIADDAEIPQMLFYEKDAIRTAFAYFDALDCQGAVIKINGEIKAFAIGEMLKFSFPSHIRFAPSKRERINMESRLC